MEILKIKSPLPNLSKFKNPYDFCFTGRYTGTYNYISIDEIYNVYV